MHYMQENLGDGKKITRQRQKDDVYASKGGKVIKVVNVPDVPDGTSLADKISIQGSYGNYVVVKDDNGKYWQYCHLKSTAVTENATVNVGEHLGTIGNTGNSKTPHLHQNLFDSQEAYESHDKTYNRTSNPLTEIRNGGVWPCNTKVSGSHNEVYPGKWRGDNLDAYSHEGKDFSGNFGDPNNPNDMGNLIPGWDEFEINVEIASQGYDMYESQLEYKNRLERQYDEKVGQESLRLDGIYEEWNETSKVDGFTPLTDAQIKARKDAYMKTYKTKLANEYTAMLINKDNQIDNKYDELRANVTKELEEYYVMCKVIKSIKDDVLSNNLRVDELSSILSSRCVEKSSYSNDKRRPDKNTELREKLFQLDTDIYERMLTDEENLVKVINGEMSVESYANHIRKERIAAEQARLAAEAEAARLAEEQRLAEEKRKAEEEAERKRKEEEEKKKQEQSSGGSSGNEGNNQGSDGKHGKDKNDNGKNESGNTNDDNSNEEGSETTTPIPNDETGDDTTTTTTTGDDGGSNTGGNTDTVGGGGTPGTGGGHHGPELGEAPDMWATSIGNPHLPEGFYVTRIAGLSSLNAAYEAAFEAGELDRNFFDEVSNLRTVQSVSLFARECEVN